MLVALVAAVLFPPQDLDTLKKGFEKAAWFNSNNYFAGFGDHFAPANHELPLLQTWSLAVEIQFYLLAPVMVLLLPIRWLKWIFFTLIISLTAMAEYRLRLLGIEQPTYYSLYARMPEFFVCGLAAIFVATVSKEKIPAWLGTLGFFLIVLATIIQPHLGPFPSVSVLLPVIGCMLLLVRPASGLEGNLLSGKT